MVEKFLGLSSADTTRGRKTKERRGLPMHPKPVKPGGPQPKPQGR